MSQDPRTPPFSMAAEQSVLGGLMLSAEAFDKIADVLVEDDFYNKQHRLVYRAICSLADKNAPFDAVTLGDWFQRNELLDEIGGAGTLIDLANNTPSAANIAAYAEIVRETSSRRQVAGIAEVLHGAAFADRDVPIDKLVSDAELALSRLGLSGGRAGSQLRPIRDIARDAVRIIQERFERGGGLPGLSVGFQAFDDMGLSLEPSDLVILAARPSMGKTAMALGMAGHLAFNQGLSVGIFSMEMSSSQLVFRLISSLSGVDSQLLRSGEVEDDGWPLITGAIATLSASNLHIDDTPSLSPMELRARARKLQREHGLDVLFIDYLQLMQVPGSRDNRTNDIAAISRSLKGLAKELNIPVVALSQLNRSLENRANRRPQLADLRESGSIEQDADVVLFVYRDDYYNRDRAPDGITEVIVGKQRNGPTGTLRLTFDPGRICFRDLVGDDDIAGGYTAEVTQIR